MLKLAQEVDFKTGESLYGLQQIDLIEDQHKKKQFEFMRQQVLLQAFMDVKRKLPPKVYDEVVMRVAKNQDSAGAKKEVETPEQVEKMEKIRKSIEYEVIPEVEQYLHRISKYINQTLLQGNAVEDVEDFEAEEENKKAVVQDQKPDFVPLGDRYAKFKTDLERMKKSIDFCKSEKQKKTWEMK